jgi:hypothetical protein
MEKIVPQNTNDLDGDGLTYQEELSLGTFDFEPTQENILKFGVNPLDSDSDGVPDNVEIIRLNPNQSGYNINFNVQIDGRTHNIAREIEYTNSDERIKEIGKSRFWIYSDPTNRDSDYDQLSDLSEITGNTLLTEGEVKYTNPLKDDTDNDGLSDKVELDPYGPRLDPLNPDYDDDGLEDGYEIVQIKNRTGNIIGFISNSDPKLKDSDSDRVKDSKEFEMLDTLSNTSEYKLNPIYLDSIVIGNDYLNEDGITCFRELDTNGDSKFDLYIKFNSNPMSSDTDNDKYSDLFEHANMGYYPLTPHDTDGDGLNDNIERSVGTSVDLIDSDGDGFDDKFEFENQNQGYNPLICHDSDMDGLPDADLDNDLRNDEKSLRTDKNLQDTDGDEVSDYNELIDGSDPLVPDQEWYKKLYRFIKKEIF